MPLDPAKRDIGCLLDIDQAAEEAIEFCAGMTLAQFRSDRRTHWATVKQIEIIGEACKRLSKSFTDAHPGVPWSEMSRMRDRLTHGYDDIDFGIVWSVVTVELPKLRTALLPLLPKP